MPTDTPSPTDDDVEDVLQEMTLEEKAGQLCGTFVGQMAEYQPIDETESLIAEYHLGSVSPFGIGGTPYTGVRETAEVANRLQRHAIDESRLDLPLFIPVDAVHGHAYVDGATVFPNNLGMGATWDPDLAERAAGITATEVSATGAAGNYSPNADVGRDQRWGRVFETFGESPRLCATLAAAKVRGYQADLGGDGVLSIPKHFPAYGEPTAGEDAAPVEISQSTFHRVFVPPFADAVDAGAGGVMPCYNSIDGEPAHGSARFLRDLLRDDLGFDGVVATDWNGVRMLHDEHQVTPSLRESVKRALEAGVDIFSIGGPGHAEAVVDLVESGDLDPAVLDDAVRHVLEAKRRAGLFEDPYVDPDAAEATLGRDEHREVAYETARKSLTLLKNDDVLPFEDVSEVLVTGPNADDLVNQFGGWSVYEGDDLTGVTVLDGVEAAAPADVTVTYEPGASLTDTEDVDAAAEKATDADAAVVVLGEGWYIHEFGPRELAGGETGEFPTRTDIRLPEAQRELLQAVAETGTPTVLVLVSGRPLAVNWAAEHVPGVLMAYYPGTEGGRAIGDALFGDAEPGGRLPISVPKSTGHLPTRFNHLKHPRPLGEDEHPDTYDPLFAFGHGLSYADFEYGDLSLSAETVAPGESVEATVTVENVGDRVGEQVVQAYVTDEVSSRVTPVSELAGFERVRLEPGERESVAVRIDAEALAVVGPDGSRTVEPGEFAVECGGQTATLAVEE